MKWIVRISLTVAYVTAVLAVDPDEQEALLRTAQDKGWSASRLSREIRAKAHPPRTHSPLMKSSRDRARTRDLPADAQFGGGKKALGSSATSLILTESMLPSR